MKKALKLILLYFIIALIGIVIGTLFYSLYLSVLNYVAGKEIVFFNKLSLINSFFYITACVLILICPVIAYSRIRHKGGILQVLFYMLLCFATWFIFMPLVLKADNKFNYLDTINSQNQTLSGDVFRKVNNNVYYFPGDAENAIQNNLPGVIIDIDAENGLKVQNLQHTDVNVIKEAAKPYSDTLIKEAFNQDKIMNNFTLKPIILKARSALNKGKSFWFGFLSFALVLCSLYGITSFFKWKLMNAWFICFSSFLIIFVNIFYNSPLLDGFKNKFVNSNHLLNSLSSNFDEPLLVIVNCFFSLLFIIIGIVKFFVNKKNGGE